MGMRLSERTEIFHVPYGPLSHDGDLNSSFVDGEDQFQVDPSPSFLHRMAGNPGTLTKHQCSPFPIYESGHASLFFRCPTPGPAGDPDLLCDTVPSRGRAQPQSHDHRSCHVPPMSDGSPVAGNQRVVTTTITSGSGVRSLSDLGRICCKSV